MENQSSDPDREKRLIKTLDIHIKHVSVDALSELIEVLEDPNEFEKITPEMVNLVGNYNSINVGDRTRFSTGANKSTAGVLRIANMLGQEGRNMVLSELIGARNSLDFAQKLSTNYPLQGPASPPRRVPRS